MSFILRQIAVTASGRRIARDQALSGARVTIGRAAGNDCQIADLAVLPHHAVIEATGPRRITVRALGDLGFTLDGRQVRSATLNAATGAELGFGATTIAITTNPGGAVLLTVENRGDTGADAGDPVADKAAFALRTAMPSTRLIGWGLLVAILAVFLALPVITHWTRGPVPAAHAVTAASAVIGDKVWSPGELSLAHRGLSNRCEACHVRGFESVRNATCSGCHREVHDHAGAAQLALARGAIGVGGAMLQQVGHALGREAPGACVDCHVEHQGAQNQGGGAMAPPRQQFCADCHAGLGTRLPHSALGSASDFGTQHPQFRASVVTNDATGERHFVSLDAHPVQDTGLTFSHRVHLDATGGVAKMALTLGAAGYGKPLECASCHHRSADGVSFQPVKMDHDCEACHSLVYARQGTTLLRLRHGDVPQMLADLQRAGPTSALVTGRARPGDVAAAPFAAGGLYAAHFGSGTTIAERAMASDGICGECHKAVRRDGVLGVKPVRETLRWFPNGWFNHAAHRQTACADCHAAARSTSASEVLMPGLSTCRSCHRGENAIRPAVASGCAMCHNYHPSAFAPAAEHRHPLASAVPPPDPGDGRRPGA